MLKNLIKLVFIFSFSCASISFAAPLQKLGNAEGQLNVVAWAGYLERGETMEDFDWVTGYEDNTGCKVNIKTAGTSDEMVALMNEGGFDIVTASGDASLRLIAGGKVQEINTLEQEIGNFRKNGPKLLQLQRDENMRPLYKKLSEVIAEVAKANGYTQILTTNRNEFAYLDERFDITKLVLEKLGIKE